MKVFDSEYCNVCYKEKDNIVLLTWKKFAFGENYRQPTLFAFELLKEFKNSNFVVDARNGFEDDQEDAKWGFSVLLPKFRETTCKFVCFIMNEINDIEEEMDMWTKEFNKYVGVIKTTDYEEALEKMKEYY